VSEVPAGGGCSIISGGGSFAGVTVSWAGGAIPGAGVMVSGAGAVQLSYEFCHLAGEVLNTL
jgi:hypothetical protein